MASESPVLVLDGFILVIVYFLTVICYMVTVRKLETYRRVLSVGDRVLAVCPIVFGMNAIFVLISPCRTMSLSCLLFSAWILLGTPSFPSSFETAKTRIMYNFFSYRSAVVVLLTSFAAIASSLPQAGPILFITYNCWLVLSSVVTLVGQLTTTRPLRSLSGQILMHPFYLRAFLTIFFGVYGIFDVFFLWFFCVCALFIIGGLLFGVLSVIVIFGASAVSAVFFVVDE